MRDFIRIKKKDGSEHFEIRRTMTEVVNRSNLEERKNNLEMQIEATQDTLDTLKKNLDTVKQALNTGFGQTEKEIIDAKAIGNE